MLEQAVNKAVNSMTLRKRAKALGWFMSGSCRLHDMASESNDGSRTLDGFRTQYFNSKASPRPLKYNVPVRSKLIFLVKWKARYFIFTDRHIMVDSSSPPDLQTLNLENKLITRPRSPFLAMLAVFTELRYLVGAQADRCSPGRQSH